MIFSKKLDIIMKITNTSNIALAKHLVFDPSYISKLRNGTRTLSSDNEYIMPISKYLAKNCDSEEKNNLLRKALGDEFEYSTDTYENIYKFLCDKSGNLNAEITLLDLSELSSSKKNKNDEQNLLCFYGDEGRTDAMCALFSNAIEMNENPLLLFFSDERAAWTEEFTCKWNKLMWQVIANGGRINVIHKISNDIDEMFDTILRWLPFYATGAIGAYYYPKLRDGIYKRSLSVLVANAATFSTSIGMQDTVSPTFLTTELPAVNAFTDEFYSYLSLCKPLIEFFDPMNDKYEDILAQYTHKKNRGILKSSGLPIMTMPEDVITEISSSNSMEIFQHKYFTNKITSDGDESETIHIICLDEIENILEGKTYVASSTLGNQNDMNYTPSQYKRHLENIVELLRNIDRFSVYIDDNKPNNLTLHVFEDNETFIFNEVKGGNFFKITEKNTTEAFWEYMNYMVDSLEKKQDKEATINRLNEIIGRIN